MATVTQPTVMTIERVKELLGQLKSAPSGIRMSTDRDYSFQVEEVKHDNPTIDGFIIRCGFWRPDTTTGVDGEGFGRWIHFPRSTSDTGVIMSAWVCIDLVIRHEAMEAFEFRGVKILDPHKNLDELAHPKTLPLLP